ncbi:MAG: hypothetical protein ACOVNY_13165 [Chitinophagaceae bacterium]
MKKLIFLSVIITALATSCVKVEFNEDYSSTVGNRDTTSTVISGKITSTVTYKKGKYTLKGYVYVTNNAQLIFEPGCVVVSDISEKGAIIVERGSKLIAEGTSTQPIVFTSGKAPGQRVPGDWGGIILLGKAPTNRPASPEPIVEGGVNRSYGGNDPADNSGVLRFVRIEFAGIAAEPGSEINGLTLAGVGNGTFIENVQVSYGNDDAYEFFGGTVNTKRLIAFATMDDDFDYDFGYVGLNQYGIALRDKPCDTDQANGVECDNDGSGTTAAPFTKPVLVNYTLLGPYDTTGANALHGFGNRWRRNTRFVMRNSILGGHRLAGFSIESGGSLDAYIANESEFKNNLVHAYRDLTKTSDAAKMTAAAMQTKAEADACIFYTDRALLGLPNAFKLDNPSFLPGSGSPALTGASFTGLSSFFTTGTFRGAMGTTDWTANWASWTPKTNVY